MANSETSSLTFVVTLNESAVVDDEADDPTESRSFYYARIVIVCATMVTFVWGFIGNLLVLYVVGRHANVRVKSVANYYIWNLAMADILYVLALPLTGFVTHTDSWPFRGRFGTISCKLAYVFRETTRYTSMYTLAALTVDRCLACYPSLRRFRKIRCGKVLCAVVWICSLIATTPLIIFAKAITYRTADGGRTTRCFTAWPKNGTETADLVYIIPWTAFDNLFGFLVPTVVISVSYFRLFRRLRKLSAVAHGGASAGIKRRRPDSNDVSHDELARERTLPSPAVVGAASRRGRMTHTVTAAVVTHVCLQLPFHVTQIISLERTVRLMTTGEVAFSAVGVHVYLWGVAVAQILVFVSSCCNPVIYGIMNDNFRQLYIVTLCPFATCAPHRPQISDNPQPTGTARIPIGSGQPHHNELPVAVDPAFNDAQAASSSIARRASGAVVVGSRRRTASDGGNAGGGYGNSRIQFHIFCHSPCTPSAAKRKKSHPRTVDAVGDGADVSCNGSSDAYAVPLPHANTASTSM